MGLIYQTDKRVGITYVYENEAYRDKETKQPRSRRKLVGKLDKETGEIVPTDGRHRKDRKKENVGKEPDYKVLYEKLQKKYTSQEVLIQALRIENDKLKRKL